MKGIHQYLALLIASIIFLISFTFKFLLDIISVGLIFRDFVMFLGIYWVTKSILSKVEVIFVLSKKVSGE
ncbi:MAG: hypothetical protein N3C60_00445 [Calditerrivibrio sp.]|nr:hypothetical protein [Calditerrivibrio sp.]